MQCMCSGLCMCTERVVASKVIASLLGGFEEQGSLSLPFTLQLSLTHCLPFSSSCLASLCLKGHCANEALGLSAYSSDKRHLINLHTHTLEGVYMHMHAHILLSNYFLSLFAPSQNVSLCLWVCSDKHCSLYAKCLSY